MIQTDAGLYRAILKIPGPQGWYKTSSEADFQELGQTLVGEGLSHERAINVLRQAYAAVAHEFGS